MIPSRHRTEPDSNELPGVPSHLAVDGLCLSMPSSGIGRYTRYLLEGMVALAPRMRVSLALPREFASLALPESLAKIDSEVTGYTLSSSFSQARWDTFALRRWLQGLQPSLFFQPNFVIPPGTLDCPVVVMIHDVSFRILPDTKSVQFRVYMDRVVRRAIRHADGILVHSESVRQDLCDFYEADPKDIRVVEPAPTGATIALTEGQCIATQEKFAGGNEYFLHLSNFDPRKNVDRLLRAYARFRLAGGTENLVLAGEGRERHGMQQLADRLQLQEHCFFPGRLNEEDRHSLLCAARAFLFPSLYEGYGLPIIEAMRVETPVMTSSRGALLEAAGEAALTVEPRDEKALQEALHELAEDEDLRARLREAGSERVRNLTWQNTATKTLRFFDEILRRLVRDRSP